MVSNKHTGGLTCFELGKLTWWLRRDKQRNVRKKEPHAVSVGDAVIVWRKAFKYPRQGKLTIQWIVIVEVSDRYWKKMKKSGKSNGKSVFFA